MKSKIGTYSITTSFALPWKNKPKSSAPEKKKKKTLKPIVNPIFEKCASLTEDRFWQTTFMECARGKFPRSFSYKNNLITYRKGNKMIRLEISNSPSEVFSATKEFFGRTAGIMSKEDRRRLQKLEEEKLAEKLNQTEEITWKDIKIEKMKDILIGEFITSLAETMEFNEEEKKELTTTIKKGFMLKYFTANNVVLSEGRISEIDGLFYNEETNEYEIDESYMIRKSGKKVYGLGVEKSDKKPEVNFLEIWTKYLEGLETKRVKKNYSSSYSTNQSDELTNSTYTS